MTEKIKLATIQLYHGTPTIFLKGQPVFGSFIRGVVPTVDNFENSDIARGFAQAGIHFYSFDAGTYATPPEWCPSLKETGPIYDFSVLERKITSLLNVDPDGYIFFRIHLDMPDWWLNQYPEEREILSDGTLGKQSFASTLWRDQFKTFLGAFVGYLRTSGLSEHVIGYQPGGGNTTEWVKEFAMADLTGDYSLPMKVHFRNWLKEYYQQDEYLLRKAWRDPYVSFETAEISPAKMLLRITPPTFREPLKEQSAIDYFRCWNDLCADLAIDACKTVKEASENEALAGVFSGKLFELAWDSAFFGGGMAAEYGAYQRSGHLSTQRVLESPYVDFVTSSYTYAFRSIGGEGAPMLPTESVSLHGKVHLYDDDSRTYLSTHAGINYGIPKDLADSVAILKRNFSEALTRGLAISWIGGLRTTPHIDPIREPAFQELLNQFQEIGTFALNLDRTPSAEIAVLIDEKSFLYETVRNSLDLPAIVQQRVFGLPRMGAPVDIYLLQDFIEGRLKPYKMYLFLNAFHLDKENRQKLNHQLRRDGRVAVWIYGAGYLDEEGSLANMSEMTGFSFEMGEHPWGPMMNLIDFNHPITEKLPQDFSWGTNSLLAPVFHLANDGARILGNVVYSEGRCRAGLGVKEFPEWKSIYCAAPNLPAGLLRGMAKYAGVHLYSEKGDILYAAKNLMGIHTTKGGERVFRLPNLVEQVVDLFTKQIVAEHTNEIKVDLAPASTVLYYTGKKIIG
jgi:hypothetical protein